jgi:membrane peptidoglycan carboxypeptidase
MTGVVEYGTGTGANIGRPQAGKTGTTQDYRDAWFAGFVPQLTTVVWMGNDDNSKMKKVTGGSLPARVWADFMRSAVGGEPALSLAAANVAYDNTPKTQSFMDEIIEWGAGAPMPDQSTEPVAAPTTVINGDSVNETLSENPTLKNPEETDMMNEFNNLVREESKSVPDTMPPSPSPPRE